PVYTEIKSLLLQGSKNILSHRNFSAPTNQKSEIYLFYNCGYRFSRGAISTLCQLLKDVCCFSLQKKFFLKFQKLFPSLFLHQILHPALLFSISGSVFFYWKTLFFQEIQDFQQHILPENQSN